MSNLYIDPNKAEEEKTLAWVKQILAALKPRENTTLEIKEFPVYPAWIDIYENYGTETFAIVEIKGGKAIQIFSTPRRKNFTQKFSCRADLYPEITGLIHKHSPFYKKIVKHGDKYVIE